MQEAPVLRPLSVGDIIDRMLRLFRANPMLFITIALLPSLVVELLQRVAGVSQTFDLNDFSAAFTTPGANPIPRTFRQVDPVLATVVGLIAAAVSLIQIGALVEAIGQRYLGRPITVREAYVRGLRAVPRLILAGIVAVFGLAVVFLLIAAALALLSSSSSLVPVAVLIGLVAFLFLFPWALLSLAVVGPAIVLEHLGPIAAIRRSFHLMDRARLRALGLYFLLWIITIVVGIVFGVIFLVSFVSEPTLRAVLQTIASVASSAIAGPLLYGAAVLLYYDLRVRKEAFDLQLAAEALPREG